MIVIALVVALVPVVCSALFAVRAWRTGRFSLRDRTMAAAELLGVAASFAFASLFGDWVQAPVGLWIAAVVITAGGTVGLVRRFGDLPWVRTWRWWPIRAVRLVLGGAAGVALLALAVT